MEAHEVDVVVVGGGIAALWLVDALDERGFATVLLEPGALGEGQTLSSQGIIHGGLKYTLRGLLNPSAEAVSQMPERWRRSLAGELRPDLRSVPIRSPSTWLWRSESLRSKLGMLGARAGLRATPIEVALSERPAILRTAPGTVYRVDEPVLDTIALVQAFAERHRERMRAIDGVGSLEVERRAGDRPWRLRTGGAGPSLAARAVVLAAGGWNEALRARFALPSGAMQRRPLHMVMVRAGRGDLPELHGHCVDGAATRVTITSSTDRAGRRIWQLGGQLAEQGVALDPTTLLATARRELAAVLPDLDPAALACEWASYRIDRAERANASATRPDDAQCLADELPGLMTLWPTKLALAPRGAALVLDELARRGVSPSGACTVPGPRPTLGTPPWERAEWFAQDPVTGEVRA